MRVCIDCPRLIPAGTRCTDCARTKERARGTRQERGYNAAPQATGPHPTHPTTPGGVHQAPNSPEPRRRALGGATGSNILTSRYPRWVSHSEPWRDARRRGVSWYGTWWGAESFGAGPG